MIELVIGKFYNFRFGKDRLIYIGKKGIWNQFEKIDERGKIWTEVIDENLHLIEATKLLPPRKIEITKNPDNKFHYFEGNYYYTFTIDGKKSSCIAETYDIAMILALAIKYDGTNTKMHKSILRSLNIKSCWSE